MTKRCLYLFAGLADENGIVIANIFEHPEPHPQKGQLCLTYSMLFNSTLLEYLKDTNDYETAYDLWCVARRQMEYALNYVNKDYLFDPNLYAPNWFFLDWRDGLDAHTPMQGAILFALNETYELACMLGKEKEVSEWPLIAKKMKKAIIFKISSSYSPNDILCFRLKSLFFSDSRIAFGRISKLSNSSKLNHLKSR